MTSLRARRFTVSKPLFSCGYVGPKKSGVKSRMKCARASGPLDNLGKPRNNRMSALLELYTDNMLELSSDKSLEK